MRIKGITIKSKSKTSGCFTVTRMDSPRPALFPLLHLHLILAWKSKLLLKSDMGKLHLEVQLLNQNQSTCSENAVHISQCIPMCILCTVLEGWWCSGMTGMAHVCSNRPTGEFLLRWWSQISTQMRPPLLTFCSAVVNFFSICLYHYRYYFLLGLCVLKYYLSDKSKPHVCLCSWDIWVKWLGLSTCDNDSSWDAVVARPRSQGADRNKPSPPDEHDLYTTPIFQSRLESIIYTALKEKKKKSNKIQGSYGWFDQVYEVMGHEGLAGSTQCVCLGGWEGERNLLQ